MATLRQYFERLIRPYVIDGYIDDLINEEAHPKFLSDTWVIQRESNTDKVRRITNQANSALPEARIEGAYSKLD